MAKRGVMPVETAVKKELWDVYDIDGHLIENRVSVRGSHDLRKNEYHLVVYVWIINDRNELIISRRQKGKAFEGMWECTGGCAQKGDTSLGAAIREVKEELGVTLDPANGERFCRYIRDFPAGAGAICDVWVFRQNVDPKDFILQPEEVSEAKIVPITEFLEMIRSAEGVRRYSYAEALYAKYCKNR